MKALSLWQPWASLIAVGAKRYETRSWSTQYRGPLVICAAQRPVDLYTQYRMTSAPFREAFGSPGRNDYWRDLPLGAALCVADLVECYPTEALTYCVRPSRTGVEAPYPDDDEPHFGNFLPGRFAWRLENVRRLRSPVRVTGRQGLFDLMPAEARQVEDQLDVIERERLGREAARP